MNKRVVSSLLASLAVVTFVLPALAAAPMESEEELQTIEEVEAWAPFELNGELKESVEYENRNGVTYVTVSSFVAMVDPEAMIEEENGKVTVNSAKVAEVVDGSGNTANVVEETLNLTVRTDTPYIVANDRCLYAKDSISTVNGSVAMPVRLMAQVFNLDVDYDWVRQTVVLSHAADKGAYIAPAESCYDADTLYWLSRIIYAESGNQVLEGKIAVGNVVMNRVKSPKFPNDIYGVLYQKNQFGPASSGSLKRTPNAESVVAAKLVLEGVEVVPTALFFSRAGMSCYASRNRAYVTTIGAHAFYA